MKKGLNKMKGFNWLLIGLVVVLLAMVSLVGCVSKSEYEALQAENEVLQADYDELKANYEATNSELAAIKEVYPPRDFSSLSELQDWLWANDVSERSTTEFADAWYRKALEMQEDALKDGYIISADYDYDEETDDYAIYCVAIIDGDIWWWDPETDEPYQDESFGKVK